MGGQPEPVSESGVCTRLDQNDFLIWSQRQGKCGNGLHDVDRALCNHTETVAKQATYFGGQFHTNYVDMYPY